MKPGLPQQSPGTFARFSVTRAADCLVLAEGTPPRAAAAAFINPLTALGIVETMRREGHRALVHTAAASNLGLMLNRLCLAEEIALVNIVRSPAQAARLRSDGATFVVDSHSPDFIAELDDAVMATGATLAFDAVGGGTLATTIMSSMERALARREPVGRYGSTVHKQVYAYGRLDPRPTQLRRDYGMAWSVGGWLLFPFLASLPAEDLARLRSKVAHRSA